MTEIRKSVTPANALPLGALNAVRLLLVLMIGAGYASTMALGPGYAEVGRHVGYDPSWFGLQVLFFLSGFMAWRSVSLGRTGLRYMRSRVRRTLPVLALYTLAVVSVLYPALCQPGALDAGGLGRLALYLGKTVSLVSPGGPMPGALDEAAYMCLLQGTVWTLRWGALLHVATLALARFRPGPRGLAGLGALALLVNFAGVGAYIWADWTWLEPAAPGLRFAYPWIFGALCFAVQDRMPRGAGTFVVLALLLFGLAGAHDSYAAWSPVIEMLGTFGWCALALALLRSDPRLLRACPPLALPVYLGVWPVAQTVLYAQPDIATPTLIGATLGISVVLGYASFIGLSGVLRPPAANQLKRPRTA